MDEQVYYYEISFYYYDSLDPKTGVIIEDERTDHEQEFLFYCQSRTPITTTEEMVAYLREQFPVTSERNVDKMNCIAPEHYKHLNGWYAISAGEFESFSGIQAWSLEPGSEDTVCRKDTAVSPMTMDKSEIQKWNDCDAHADIPFQKAR